MSKFSVAGTMAIAVVGLAVIGGCITSYGARGAFGGFSETMLSADVARVRRMRNNEYTSGERAKDLTLLRAAEIMLGNDLPYFAVLNEKNGNQVGTDAAPETTLTSETLNTSDNNETNSANTTYVSGESFINYKPEKGILVRGFKEKPKEFFTFDAELTIQALKSKYKME
jgi:hypothetical protein